MMGKTLRAIVITALAFGAVGPVIGAAVIWLQRPPGHFRLVLLLSYVFGGVPALIAGVAYGVMSVRGSGLPARAYARALVGAGAGLFGCLAFFVFVSVYDFMTRADWTMANLDLRFLRLLVPAGIPSGAICALLMGSGRRRMPGAEA